MQITGVLVLFAALWFIRYNPMSGTPATPASERTASAPADQGYMAATNPWAVDDGSDEASSIYYPNCAAARSSGAAPIRRGEPGYVAEMDKDGDGLVCETPERG